MHPSRMLGGLFRLSPFVQHVPFYFIKLSIHFWRIGICCQFQTMSIRVEEIDGLEYRMVRDTDNLDTVSLQLSFGFFQHVYAFNLEGDVLNPIRCIRVFSHFRLRREFKEGQDISLTGIQKDMHVRIGSPGRWHFVLGNRQNEVHVQVLAVPFDSFLGILAAVSNMVDFLNFHRIVPSNLLALFGGIDDATADLIAFHRFEQSLEVPFPKAIVALALDEFEEHRSHQSLGKNLQQQTRRVIFGGPIQ